MINDKFLTGRRHNVYAQNEGAESTKQFQLYKDIEKKCIYINTWTEAGPSWGRRGSSVYRWSNLPLAESLSGLLADNGVGILLPEKKPSVREGERVREKRVGRVAYEREGRVNHVSTLFSRTEYIQRGYGLRVARFTTLCNDSCCETSFSSRFHREGEKEERKRAGSLSWSCVLLATSSIVYSLRTEHFHDCHCREKEKDGEKAREICFLAFRNGRSSRVLLKEIHCEKRQCKMSKDI